VVCRYPTLFLLGSLAASLLVSCSRQDDATRWEPHVVPSATSEPEKPARDGKPEPERKLKRKPGTRN